MPEVLVLGATGTTGSRVAAFLARREVAVRRATRTPGVPGQVRFDWADRATYAPALRGVSAVYLIAPLADADPVASVEPFLAEAARQGVRRVVQLSSSAVPEGAPGLGEVHRLVRATSPEWAVLRPSWFMQNFTGDHLLARDARAGEIVTATGVGRVAFVDAGDIAAVAGHALTDGSPHNTEHVLTGPESLAYAEAAAIVARRLGHPVRHRSVTAAELAERLADRGMPTAYATVLAALDTGIAAGAEDRVTDTVTRVTGHPPRGFREFAEAEL